MTLAFLEGHSSGRTIGQSESGYVVLSYQTEPNSEHLFPAPSSKGRKDVVNQCLEFVKERVSYGKRFTVRVLHTTYVPRDVSSSLLLHL